MTLCPSQQRALDEARVILQSHAVVTLTARRGNGRTTVLRELARELSAPLVTLADVFHTASAGLHPLQIEEAFARTVFAALDAANVVIIDDYHRLEGLFEHCYGMARPPVLSLATEAILRRARDGDKQLVFGGERRPLTPLDEETLRVAIEPFEDADFAHLLRAILGEWTDGIDAARVRRFAPRLDGHHLRYASRVLPDDTVLDTDGLIDFLEQRALASNVDVSAVRKVTLESLHGVEDVIRALEIDVIVPLERPDLAKELNLVPKQGVLLYGPPGTGKTTIGRALAHRLRSKFFVIDGTLISGTHDFYPRLAGTFQAAKANAPSVLFIDDSDLLFESDDETGLYRYLLTMLDGLITETDGAVTVMMTAMNVGSLPPALIRSGRVELWLEMTLPDAPARAAILTDLLPAAPAAFGGVDVDTVVAASVGFTGADLNRVVGDATNLLGYDISRSVEPRPALAYLQEAIDRLLAQRRQLEQAPAFTAAHHGRASRESERHRALLVGAQSED